MMALVGCAGSVWAQAPVLHHEATVVLVPSEHALRVEITTTVPAGVDTLRINGALLRSYVERGDESAHFEIGPPEAGPPSEELRALATLGEPEYTMAYVGSLYESTDGVVFSRENVGREISGTIGEEGAYLAASTGWLPLADGAMATHRLTVVVPAGWECVTQGRRVSREEVNGRVRTVWEALNPSDGMTLVAGPYTVVERLHGDVTMSTYFLGDEPRLVETYLERTAAYLDMYEEMIGPYPYAKFATVENWFPTGYGMPSWTLLGSQVLRLPFIPYTSFGHEICHNWWGNSMFVDESGGNWCEGLTVWCADYHYKELESDAEAREYRRNTLKDYAAYVHSGRDIPLAEFRERHSGATRAVGYGKALMVYHMLDRMIGRPLFLEGLREAWSVNLFREADWDDVFAAFARVSRRDLGAFRDQWLHRTGAPLITLADARRDGDDVVVTLRQEEPAWAVDVPVVLYGSGVAEERVVTLDGPEAVFTFEAPAALSVAVDPDYHVFRRLHAAEIEPTLRQVLGAGRTVFALPPGDDPLAAAARDFAAGFAETDAPETLPAGAEPPADAAVVHVNPDAAALKALLPPGVQVAGSTAFVQGRRLSLNDIDLVMAVARPGAAEATDLVVLSRDARRLGGLARRLGHYGKYSYLEFPAGRGSVGKGNWETADSPLRRELAAVR